MIKAEFFTKKGNIVKFVIDGHAGFSDGDDIVCASVSSVAWAVLNGLENVAGIKFGYETGEGYIYFVLPEDITKNDQKNAGLLLDTLYLYLTELEDQYPDYISLTKLEV